MSYSQSVKTSKVTFSKNEILTFYSLSQKSLKKLHTEHFQVSIYIDLSNSESFNFNDIEEFKNEITSNDKIKYLAMLVISGIDNEVSSITLDTNIKHSTIRFSSFKKGWVDEEATMCLNYLKEKNLDYKYPEKESMYSNVSKNTSLIQISKKNKHIWNRSDKLALIGIIVTIIIAVTGWFLFNN